MRLEPPLLKDSWGPNLHGKEGEGGETMKYIALPLMLMFSAIPLMSISSDRQNSIPPLERLRLSKSIKLSPQYPFDSEPGEVLHSFSADNRYIYFHGAYGEKPPKDREGGFAYMLDLKTLVTTKLDKIERFDCMRICPRSHWLATFKAEWQDVKFSGSFWKMYNLPDCKLCLSGYVPELEITAATFDQSGRFFALAVAEYSDFFSNKPIERGRLFLYRLSEDGSWKLVKDINLPPGPKPIHFVEIIPALRWVVAAASDSQYHPFYIFDFDGELVFAYQQLRRTYLEPPVGPRKLITDMASPPDQSRLVLSYQDGLLRVWKLTLPLEELNENFLKVSKILHFPRAVYDDVFWGPNSRWLFVFGAEFIPPDQDENLTIVLHVWDMKLLELHARYKLPDVMLSRPIVSHDGKMLAAVTREGDLQLYELPQEYWVSK